MANKYDPQFMRRELIERVTAIYKKKYSDEYEQIVRAAAEIRASRSNKFGQIDDSNDEFRWVIHCPTKLDVMVNTVLTPGEPKFLQESKEMAWFLKTFPEFRTAEKY